MRLKEYRLTRGITQLQLASELGCSQARISQYERGEQPELQFAIEIAVKTGGAVSVTDWAKPRQITEELAA